MSGEINGIPAIGLGTGGLTGEAGLKAIGTALAAGYRHLDTAQSYGTEHNVGLAVARSGLDRNSVFVTTKITAVNRGRLAQSLDESLATMGLDQIDLTLIHWPDANDTPPVKSYIGDLARAQDNGKTRLIGVSNFTRRHIDEAITEIGEHRLATNQVERHLFLQNHVLADHCTARGIALTAYLPLLRGKIGEAPELAHLAQKHQADPGCIALAYLLAIGTIVIPQSTSPVRQKTNLLAGEIRLDEDDMTTLRALDRNERQIDPHGIAPDWD